MKPNTKLFFYLFIGLFLFSCNKNDESVALLKLAQDSFETNPNRVLSLLDSIENPEKMDKDDYMEYVLSYIRAKSEARKDISGDTLIFGVQRYFEQKGNIGKSALANYYVGQIYYLNGMQPKALEFFMYSADEAQRASNDLLAVKSLNNIGYIYFERDMLDSAIVNYQKALSINNNIEKSNHGTSLTSQMLITTLTNIGRTFEGANKLDSAYLYFQKGLILAKKQENTIEESQLYLNLGATCYGKREYEKAIEYYQSALNMDITGEKQIQKINLYLLNIYNEIKESKSAKQYADLVTVSLPNVTNLQTMKEMYASLSEYYKQAGDFKQALEYSNLEKATKDQIEQEANVPALLDANKNFYIKQKEREAQELREFVLWCIAGGVFTLAVILLFVIYNRRDTEKFKQEIERRTEKYDLVLGQLRAENERYPHIVAEIKAMEEDANKEENKGKEEGEK
ncbi:tetratricopeptide repeat protein [Dysgonomonas alginatilytica]|uniref:Tetratricopeptide repeat protein n=1 Tax=Dysgonomonas alginatilytica TaxID=1605892 RepID=A0A2V3PKZ9_9BACT|nr:tetratricopeptide repeat protein [Dysgonomonas alginatilytica]PXV59285.1 tetratricopeptide repeat protein [Dysgonomonas alginatilytica]